MNLLSGVKSSISRLFTDQSTLRRWMLWPKHLQEVDWGFQNQQAFVDEGFEANALVYSAIMFKVRAAYQAELRAYTGTRDAPELLPEGHELSRLLSKPNNYQSFAELQAEALVNFNLFGSAYTWFKPFDDNGSLTKGFPSGMHNFRSDWVYHVYGKDDLLGFIYAPPGVPIIEGTPLLAKDMMHVRLPNPNDKRGGMGKGLSPLVPASRPTDVDNAATAFIKKFFDSGTMPRGLISIDDPLTKDVADTAKEQWMETYGGFENWIEPVVLGRGASYQRISATFDELDLTGIDARNEGRIAMVFGVPLNLIESRPDVVQGTYSNKETDYRMFLDTVLIPELYMFEQEWRRFLTSEDKKVFAQYDFSKVPGYIKREVIFEQMMKGWEKSVVTRAEMRSVLGLPITEEDKVFFIPTPTITLSPAKESPVEHPIPITTTPAIVSLKQIARDAEPVDIVVTPIAQESPKEDLPLGITWLPVLTLLVSAQEAAYRDKAMVNWEELLNQVLLTCELPDITNSYITALFAKAGDEGWSIGRMIQSVKDLGNGGE